MRQRLAVGLSALAVVLTVALDASAFTVARDGKATCAIVVADDAIPAEKTAAKELAEHLAAVTGATFTINATSAAGQASILVGATTAVRAICPDVKWDALGHDGIVIRTRGSQLILAGGRPRGTLYAVYAFLEDTVGVRWWTSTESFVPKKPTLDVGELNTVYAPKIVYRESFTADVLNANYVQAARMKINGHHSAIPADWGGHYNILGWCHTSYALLPPDKYFADHPDWYSFHGGKRNPDGGQLCWSNEAMRKELVKHALRWIRKNPSAGIISISQNDCYGNCACDQCKAIDDAEGSPSGSLIAGINAVAAEIGKAHPDFLVETLAYNYTRHPPKTLRPAGNILVRFCSIECDFAHPLDGRTNQGFGDDLRQWAKIARNLFVWNYVTNFNNYLIPHPNLRSLSQDVRFFADNNVVGVFQQSDCYNLGAGDFLQLRTWLMAHQMWDPSRDQQQLISEFMNGYYGPAGQYLSQYLDLVNAVADRPGFRMGCYNSDIGFLTDDMIARADGLFDQAQRAVAGDAVLEKRVRRERLSLDHVHLLRYDFGAAVAARRKAGMAEEAIADAVCADYEQQARTWRDLARSNGARHFSEGGDFDGYAAGLLLRARRFLPPKLPRPGEPMPPRTYDLQEDQFTLHGKGDWSTLVADPKASDGRAARMRADHTNWAIQLQIPTNDPRFAGPGPWKCYFSVRVEAKAQQGTAFAFGAHLAGGGALARDEAPLNIAGDGEYHPYGVVVDRLPNGAYFWVAPVANPDVTAIYVDRIYVTQDPRK